MKKCNTVKQTCGQTSYATCTQYEGTVNPQSELAEDSCLDIEQTTQDLYDQMEEVKDQLDLSELGEACLDYVLEEGKILVKNVLLLHEEKICELQERVTELETIDICNKSIVDCGLDLSCIDLLPCDAPILTFGDLMQAMINKICETP